MLGKQIAGAAWFLSGPKYKGHLLFDNPNIVISLNKYGNYRNWYSI